MITFENEAIRVESVDGQERIYPKGAFSNGLHDLLLHYAQYKRIDSKSLNALDSAITEGFKNLGENPDLCPASNEAGS